MVAYYFNVLTQLGSELGGRIQNWMELNCTSWLHSQKPIEQHNTTQTSCSTNTNGIPFCEIIINEGVFWSVIKLLKGSLIPINLFGFKDEMAELEKEGLWEYKAVALRSVKKFLKGKKKPEQEHS